MQSAEDQRFETMTMPHINALFQTALQLTDNRAGAEKVVYVVYARAWKSLDGRDEWTDWRIELFKILVQRIHRGNRGWFGSGWPREVDQPAENYTEELVDSNTFAYSPGQMIAALTKVPVVFREIILLVDCQEFSYKETADILGLSTEVVADRLVLGRKHLRSELDAARSTLNATSKNTAFMNRELNQLGEPFV